MKTSKFLFSCIAGLLFSTLPHAIAVDIELVNIGDAGNIADTVTGYGAVDYEYSIGKYEVTNAQYIEFLNAVAKSDPYELYSDHMASTYGGIERNGSSGNFSYNLKNNDLEWANRPVSYVNWYDTVRFINWLNNGATSTSDTESGAYTLTGIYTVVAYDGTNLHDPSALYWLPSYDEWYKAAYYKGGGTDAGYWLYPTQSDAKPVAGIDANYNNGSYVDPVYGSTPVGAFDNDSYYGTYDQGGNAWEWNESGSDLYRGMLGSSWIYSYPNTNFLASTGGGSSHTHDDISYFHGFRVASSLDATATETVPEPMTMGLLITGLIGIAFRKRK